MRRRALYSNTVNTTPNTFIGGVASIITDKNSLATKLSISESDISYFEVIGNNIEARVNADYSIGLGDFNGNLITYFRDEGARCIQVNQNAFKDSTSLTEFYSNANGRTYGIYVFINVPSGLRIEIPNYYSIYQNTFAACGATHIDIRSALTLGASTGYDKVFENINMSVTPEIIANSSLQTANSGSEEADLLYARNRGCTITYI